jgi:hemerythrin-like metal-binding protein
VLAASLISAAEAVGDRLSGGMLRSPLHGPVSGDEAFLPVDWDPERFGVGIEAVDEPHRRLLRIVNRMCIVKVMVETNPENLSPVNKVRTGIVHRHLNAQLQRGSEMSALLDALVTYCAKHLTAEELLLETHGYPDRAAHAQEHQLLVNEVCRAQRLSEEGNLEMSDVRNLVTFLRRWMNEHIPKDRRFAPLLMDKGY